MTSASAPSDVTDGPVLTLLNKRIRNLKKKLNRISQLEESVTKGISAIKNKEQEDLIRSKPSIVAAVDELEKLRQPLISAVDEEINLAVKHRQTGPSEAVSGNETLGNDVNVSETKTESETETETLGNDVNGLNKTTSLDEVIEDLLKLIYIGSMFDVKSQNDFNSIMLTRTIERNCCLTYDYVTDDDVVMLGESDLDLISKMSSLLISRPVDLSFSHQNALQRCVEHAKLWLAKSEEQIDSNATDTYASLREKLTKIIGSDYFKITPEMKAPSVVAAEAAGNYVFQVPVQVESTVTPQEQSEENPTDFQRNETQEGQSIPVEDSHEQHEPEAENSTETQVQVDQGEADAAGTEYKEQYVPRRSYHNQRGGGRSSLNGGRSGGRGYGGGRGGRSGGRGGLYQNGRNQYYEQSGNYYPSNQRNYYGGRGRGGRGNGGGGGGGGNGNGNGYNHHASGVEVAQS